MTISEVKRRARATEWMGHIREQQESGLSVRSWCEARGFTESRYYYWLRIIRTAAIEQAEQAAQGGALVRVEPERLRSATPNVPVGMAEDQGYITIRYGKAAVELPAGTPVSVIGELLKALDTP